MPTTDLRAASGLPTLPLLALLASATLVPALPLGCSDDSSEPSATPCTATDAAGQSCPACPDAGATERDAGPPADAGPETLDAGSGFTPATAWTVRVAESAPDPVHWAADDVVRLLRAMGLQADDVLLLAADAADAADVDCQAGRGQVLLLGDGLGAPVFADLAEPDDQSWGIAESRCAAGGVLVRLWGGGLLGRQYAAYEWLHELGVRFFHPEQEYVPTAPHWPPEPLRREHRPAFRWRSVSLHLTHPLELGDAYRLGDPDYAEEVRRYIDWKVRNLSSMGSGGLGAGELRDYGHRRGFPRGAGLSLYNQQQGGGGLLDPEEEDWEPIIAAAIERAVGDDPERRPATFSFSFNPTEFSEVDDRKVVAQMHFIAEHMATHHPDVRLLTTNHGTYGEPTPHYGVRYFDLPRFAPPSVGVKCHSLMFYDLFRPAPMYGNESFDFLYEFMLSEYTTRELWHFPEAAWWLTFDIQVPLYLPITIEARDRDIQGIAFMLEGKLTGHRTFGSGHEWGYWQNEYCSLRLAADLDYRWTDCLADICSPFGPSAAGVQAVLEELVLLQERDFIYGDILRYLVGSDPETEAAASVGVHFHPLPPSPGEVAGWEAAQVQDYLQRIEPALARMERDHARLRARLDELATSVPANGEPWFAEIYDGVHVNELRARHQRLAYGALVRNRQAQLERSGALAEDAAAALAEAEQVTEEVLAVVARREQGYRYRPLERAIGGGPACDEDDNWTGYAYRYLCRTHHGYYFRRIDELVAGALRPQDQVIELSDTLLGPGEALRVRVLDPDLQDVRLELGDGTLVEAPEAEHTYEAAGVYTVTLRATRAGEAVELTVDVAALQAKLHTGFSGVAEAPAGVEIIEGLLPSLVLGPVDETTLALGFAGLEGGPVAPGAWTPLTAPEGSGPEAFRTSPALLSVPAVQRSDGTRLAELRVDDAVLSRSAAQDRIELAGVLSTQAIVDAVVEVGAGAFDPAGARRMVASFLGYPEDELPEGVPFLAAYTLQSPDPPADAEGARP